MEQFLAIGQGFVALTTPAVFLAMIGGFFVGTVFAAIPGLTGTLAIALLLPMTFSMDVTAALVMCASIFMGGQYGGSITAITVNIPGAPCSVMTAYEGNKLMRRGEGVRTLRAAALASMIGGLLGAAMLMAFSPFVAEAALYVRTPGKFSLILFALFVIIISNQESIAKGIVATLLGLMIATIGIDVASSAARQTFGNAALVEGVQLMAVIIGAFAISELFVQSTEPEPKIDAAKSAAKAPVRDFIPKMSDFHSFGAFKYIKCAILGHFVGVLPGAGGSSASFISYAEARRSSAKPEEYGNGSIEGVSAAECANNSMCGGSLVPMLTFGIPGDTTAAVILGVLIINGLTPGPQLMSDQFTTVTPMMAALFVSSLLIPLSLAIFGPYYMRLVTINRGILFSAIALVAMAGAYVSTYSTLQMGLALVVGIVAYLMYRSGYPIVSFLLGYLLGPDLEVYMRRSLSITDGDPSIFFTSPDSVFFLLMIVVFFYFMVIRPKRQAKAGTPLPDDQGPTP